MSGPSESSAPGSPDERRLELSDDLADGLREIVKRWNDRLTPERLSISEAYRQGRVSLVLYLKCSGSIGSGDFNTTRRGDLKNEVTPDALAVIKAHSENTSDGHDRNQQFVFIDNVEFVEDGEGTIASDIRVWPHDVNDKRSDVGRPTSVFWSPRDGSYHILPRFPEREPGVSGLSAVEGASGFPPEVVHRRVEIVNDVPDNQRGDARQSWGRDFERGFAGARIRLDPKAVEVTLGEGGESSMQILDVLVGPFDL
jgi:hypothetical protein